MKSYTQDYKNIIVPIVQKYLSNARIILYGSRARGDDKPGSDIDIALDIGRPINIRILTQIINDIGDSDIPILFDIVDFYAVSERMQKEILKDGIEWKK